MTSTYELYKQHDDDMLVTMLLVADDREQSLSEAAAEDAVRAERLRTLLADAQGEAGQDGAAQDSGAGWTDQAPAEGEQSEADAEEADVLLTEDGQILHGTYRFLVSVWGSLQLKDGDTHIAWVPDAWDIPLGTTGWIVIDGGVATTPVVDPPPPPEPEPELVDPAQIQAANIGLLNAMFVDGAGTSQRSARVLADGVFMILKNVHDSSGDNRLNPRYGTGEITFVRNRMSPNEIIIKDEIGLDVEYVKAQLKDLFERDLLQYPYRDKSRIRIHD